jgi:CubicO group peptidase (beta-lactamase class C family)
MKRALIAGLLACGGSEPANPGPDAPIAEELGVFAVSADYAVLDYQDREHAFVHGVSRLAYSLRIPLAGDFDGDGYDSIATYDYRSGELAIKHANAEGPDAVTSTMVPGRIPVAGDFDDDGVDTVALYDPASATFDVDGSSVILGSPGSQPLAGDFDGDGVDTVAVFERANQRVIGVGLDVALPIQGTEQSPIAFAGDLDGDGSDNVGYYAPSTGTFHWLADNTSGRLEQRTFGGTAFHYMPIIGRWERSAPTPPRGGYSWPTAPPDSFDPSALDAAVAFARTMPGVHSLLVARSGKLVVEDYMGGFTATTPQCIKSVSKSILSMLYGAAWEDGLIAVDTPLVNYLPAVASDSDPRRSQILVAHMLTMTAGAHWVENDATFWPAFTTSPDPVSYVTSQPMIATPGATFHYNTGLTLLAAHVLDDRTPDTLLGWARSRVLDRLGIDVQRWDRDADGYYFGGTEMYMPPRDLARFGELYRLDGLVDGDQIIRADWVRDTPRPVRENYGAYWWNRRSNDHDVFYAWGYGGQMVFVVKSLELVVVVTHAWEVTPQISGDNANRAYQLLDRIVGATR